VSTGYDLVRPCPRCPFRANIEAYITGKRAEEIADGLRMGGEFYCHETVHYDSEETDEEMDFYTPRGDEKHCAGALIVMENGGEPSQMMRITERLGLYDASKLDRDSPVYSDLDEFVDYHMEVNG
jgi:hypothetical protein